jgi:hypothetical protein
MDVNSGEWTGKMAGLGAGVGKDISSVSPISRNDKNMQLILKGLSHEIDFDNVDEN